MEEANFMEIILSSPGLQHIAETIVKYLDIQSVAKCRVVSTSFQDLIDGQKFWYVQQIQKINTAKGAKGKRNMKIRFGEKTQEIVEFSSVFKHKKILLDTFDARKPLRELKIVAKYITEFLAKKDFNTSPFYQAFKDGKIDFIKLFINSPLIDFSEIDDQGHTIFYHACDSGSKEIVQLLIQEFNNCGETDGLLDGADDDSDWSDISDSEDEFEDVVQDLEQDLHLNPLNQQANNHGYIEPVNNQTAWAAWLLQGDLESDDEDEVYVPPENLDDSSEPDISEYEITLGEYVACNIWLRKQGVALRFRMHEQGTTPFHVAVKKAHIEIVEILTSLFQEKCESLEFKDMDGNTIFHVACQAGHLEIIKFLLESLDMNATANSKSEYHQMLTEKLNKIQEELESQVE